VDGDAGRTRAASVRGLAATLLGLVGTRAELAVVELRELGERRTSALLLAAVGGLFLGMGLLLAAVLVVVVFWDTYRLAAITAMTLLYLGIAAAAFLTMRARQRAAPRPFDATLRELALDRQLLRESRE